MSSSDDTDTLNKELNTLRQLVKERDRQTTYLEKIIVERDTQLLLHKESTERLNLVLNSKSWRLLSIFRVTKRVFYLLRTNPKECLYYCKEIIAQIQIRDHHTKTTTLSQLTCKQVPKIFVTDISTPMPDKDAGSVSIFFIMKILVELGYEVTFIPHDLIEQDEYTENVRRLGVNILHGKDINSIEHHIIESGHKYSAFMLCRAPVAAPYLKDIRQYAPQAKLILDTVDLHYLRDERAAISEGTKNAIDKAAKAKDWELEVISRCDVSIVLSSFEKELLSKELPQSDVRTIPLLFIDAPEPSIIDFQKREGIVFIGGFNHQPNVDAMLWFCEYIWPLVHKKLPGVKFSIIGGNPPPKVMALEKIPGVTLLGNIHDIDSLFSSARLSVAPLRYGAGIKGKVVTSLGYALPVVGTSLAFEGMNLCDKKHIMIADKANDFVNAIVKLYSDAVLWTTLSEGGLKQIRKLYSENAGRKRIKKLMNSLNLKSNDFEFFRLKSFEHYQRNRKDIQNEYLQRRETELNLIQHNTENFSIKGYCAVCNQPSEFQVNFTHSYETTNDGNPIPNWREHLNCNFCGYSNRIRLMIQALQQIIRPKQNARIYITEQTTPLFNWLNLNYSTVTGSEYFGDKVPLGTHHNKIRNEDMENLSFSDNSFDLILSCDVLEHVADDSASIAECYRCLAPGGQLVFTVPCNLNQHSNIIRAQMTEDGTIKHLITPPEYHGNPVDPENGALCFRYFGWEILDQLKAAGFKEPHVISVWSRDFAYLGGEQTIFIGTKAGEHKKSL